MAKSANARDFGGTGDVYGSARIYGPYYRKDGRKHVCVLWSNGRRQTVSYPKFITEVRLNRYLGPDETVDHIDRDYTNNSPENLRVIPLAEHVREDVRRLVPQEFRCTWCEKPLILSGRKLHRLIDNQRRRGYGGPFCGRSCAGKHSRACQLGRATRGKGTVAKAEYTTLKALRSVKRETA